MNTIYVIESLSRKGGAENALVNLVTQMSIMGHKSIIIYLWGPNDFVKELTSRNIEFHSLSMRFRWDIFRGFWRLHKIIFSSRIKLINAHNFFPMFYVALTKISIRKKKRVVTYHNMGYEVYPAKTPLKFFRKLIDIALNNLIYDGFTAVSRAVASSYSRHLYINNIHIVENMIPIDFIDEITKLAEVDKKTDNVFKIIMAGRLVHEKGYKYIIEAMEILKTENIEFQLNIFGDGPLKSEILNEIDNRNLSNLIKINSTVEHEMLFIAIKNADLFVMSSISEGFPMAPAEAMVIGTPVVATKVGGIPELIENEVSGILVPSKNPAMLAKSIAKVLNNSFKKDELIYNGRKRIDNHFSPTIICEKLIKCFTEVLEK